MSCGCEKPDKTNLWSPIPDYHQPTDILPGENIDCYAKRAGTVGKNDVAEKLIDRIDNTSITSDLDLNVDEDLKLSPGSNRVAVRWTVTIDGQPISTVLPGVTLNASTGKLSGKIAEAQANKNYEVLVKAYDGNPGVEIDSRSFNLFPKKGSKEDTIKFVFPYSPNGRVTCGYGPRRPPAPGASSMHKGIDISQPGDARGDILSAADGTVVKCGPASGFGNWVVIEHRDAKNTLVATTVYGHMNEIYVKVGQKVAAGQKIAKEGNAGIGSAAHLHFEIHRGSWGNPTNPLPYLNGTFNVAQNNLPGQDGQADPGSFASSTGSNRGMTAGESSNANVACPDDLSELQSGSEARPVGQSAPAVPVEASTAEVQLAIQRALDADTSLTAEDKKLLMFMAKIESNFKPDAKNPSSSARGLFQMLDKTAVKYYGQIGIPATEANRNNPTYATQAQIAFYKAEQKKYYNEFKSSGTIAGKQLSPEVSSRYANLSIGEFTYGLIHHDGVGNAVAGKDLQGVGYYRKKVREA